MIGLTMKGPLKKYNHVTGSSEKTGALVKSVIRWVSMSPRFMLIFLLPVFIQAGRGGVSPSAFASEAGVGTPVTVSSLIFDLGNPDDILREEALFALGRSGDPNVLPVLEALRAGNLYTWIDPGGERRTVITRDLVDQDGQQLYLLIDPYRFNSILDEQGRAIHVAEEALEEIYLGRRLRIQINPLLDRLRLFSPDAPIRESAAIRLGLSGDPEILGLLDQVLEKESDRWVQFALNEARGLVLLQDDNASVRKQAAVRLGEIHAVNAVPAMKERILGYDEGESEEKEFAVVKAIKESIQKITKWDRFARLMETIFSGVSLSSILLLVALGLAINFGLMGVINMAHGELMMLGAYTTYVIQELFTAYLPVETQDFYFLMAIPLAFIVSALFGLVLEKSIIRHLYGRPLETLLATWGISLILQQGVRQIFGAANVDVASPSWLSGGLRLAVGIQFPYNRLFIIFLSLVSVIGIYGLVLRSSVGLKIRAVTQNRRMSACMGISTEKVDAWTFALGAGLAGMAGSALTLIGNVGPDLGQNYIVDSFLIVVAGGVGKLVGTVGAAFGIGGLNKLLEPGFGAIYAKVIILIIVILFLQVRPSGLFPAKGRSVDL